MMDKHFNFRHSVRMSAAAAAVALLFVPNVSSAFTFPKFQPRLGTEGAAILSVCTRLGSLESLVENRIAAANNTYDETLSERTKTRTSAKTIQKADARARAEADAKLRVYFAELDVQAGSDEVKKEAVSAFKKTVTSATAMRREAIDAASRAFEDTTAKLTRARADEVKKIAAQMKEELAKTLQSNSTRCKQGDDASRVRTLLREELAAIDARYAERLNDRTALLSGIAAATEERTAAILRANAAFTAKLDGASQTLRAVLY